MNFYRSQFSFARTLICHIGAAWLWLISSQAVNAQDSRLQRWLFVFDTSYQMKKDLPTTITALEQMLGTSAGGQLNPGDSVGVWTYDQELHAGKLPLLAWDPAQAAVITSKMAAYLKDQRHRGESRLASLQPSLQQVVAASKRLTVVIFCDGKSPLEGTPYDEGVNQSFSNGLEDRQKKQQPFVVILRSQLGHYVSGTVAYPPGNISLPPFPELPSPPETNPPTPPEPKPEPKPLPVAPVISVPPLVIVGTNVSTNLNAAAETPKSATNTPSASNVSPPVETLPESTTNPPATSVQPTTPATNPPVQAMEPLPATNTSAASTGSHFTSAGSAVVPQPANVSTASQTGTVATHVVGSIISSPVTQTATSVGNSDKADPQLRILIWIGIGLLAAAVVLIVLLLLRPRRGPRGSLISRSMTDDPRRK